MTAELKIFENNRINKDVIRVLEEALAKAREGELTRVGIVWCAGKEWGTTFSSTDDCRVDAAMLIELGLRRLGFYTK